MIDDRSDSFFLFFSFKIIIKNRRVFLLTLELAYRSNTISNIDIFEERDRGGVSSSNL